MSTQENQLRLSSTGAALGAVGSGVDGTRALPAQDVLTLRRGLLDHHILIYKKQDLSEPQFKAFATYFGAIFQPPSDVPVPCVSTYPISSGPTPALGHRISRA